MSGRKTRSGNARNPSIRDEFRQNSRKTKHKWMKTVSFLLQESYLDELHDLVRREMYPSRSAAIRSAIRDLLKRELWSKRK